MSQQKLKLLATTTPEKPRPQPPFVQLTQEQLEAIAGGFTGGDSEDTNHNQSLVSIKEVIKSQPPPEKKPSAKALGSHRRKTNSRAI